MNHILVTHPHPACILTSLHPARRVDLRNTDVAKTWDENAPVHAKHVVGDDYDHCDRTGWLEQPGGFK